MQYNPFPILGSFNIFFDISNINTRFIYILIAILLLGYAIIWALSKNN